MLECWRLYALGVSSSVGPAFVLTLTRGPRYWVLNLFYFKKVSFLSEETFLVVLIFFLSILYGTHKLILRLSF